MSKVAWLGVVALVACTAETPTVEKVEATTQAVSVLRCVTIQRGGLGGAADATLRRNALRQNYGAQPILKVSDKDEALLRFDLSPFHGRLTLLTERAPRAFASIGQEMSKFWVRLDGNCTPS